MVVNRQNRAPSINTSPMNSLNALSGTQVALAKDPVAYKAWSRGTTPILATHGTAEALNGNNRTDPSNTKHMRSGMMAAGAAGIQRCG